MSEIRVSKQTLLNAQEEGTLAEFVADYISFGGKIEELNEINGIDKSILKEAYDKAKKIYMPKESNKKALNESLENIEVISEDNLGDFNMMSESISDLFEDVDEDIDIDVLTVGDMISNSFENMPDDQIDRDLAAFRKYARELGVKNFSDLIVYVDSDNEHDPSLVLNPGKRVELNDRVFTVYTDANMIAEVLDGNYTNYLYFPTEKDAKRYISLANKFLNGFDVSDESTYVKVGNEKIDVDEDGIKESLNKLDMLTNNKFDFLNRFICEKYSEEQLKNIRECLKEDNCTDKLDKILVKFGEDELEELKEMFGLQGE